MNDHDRKQTDDDALPRRLAYEPPRVEETASFETLALTCGQSDDFTCEFTPGGVTSA